MFNSFGEEKTPNNYRISVGEQISELVLREDYRLTTI